MTAADLPPPELPVQVITDHAQATAELLERVVNRLLAGACPADLGREVELLGIIMQRRI